MLLLKCSSKGEREVFEDTDQMLCLSSLRCSSVYLLPLQRYADEFVHLLCKSLNLEVECNQLRNT
jgi:hypothetical protein